MPLAQAVSTAEEFVQALQDGVSYLQNNPSSSWKKFVALYPELNNDLNKKSWFVTMPYFSRNPAKLNQKRYQELAQFMWKKKLIRYLPKIEEYTVDLNKP